VPVPLPLPAKAALAFVALAACTTSPPPLASCDDSLRGIWATEPGATPAATFHVVDRGAAVDAIPITRELPAEPPGTLAAPALVELRREHGQVAGRVLRRWHRGGATCRVASPAVIRGCAADRLTLQLGPTGAPSDWTTCAPTGAATALLLRRR